MTGRSNLLFSLFFLAFVPATTLAHDTTDGNSPVLRFIVKADGGSVRLIPYSKQSAATNRHALVQCTSVEFAREADVDVIVLTDARVDFHNGWFAGKRILIKRDKEKLIWSGAKTLNRKPIPKPRRAAEIGDTREATLMEIERGLIESAKEHPRNVKQLLLKSSSSR